MSFNTPRGDTSPRDMAERCLWIGYDCMDGTGMGLGMDEREPIPNGRDAVSRPGQYSSTVASHRGRGGAGRTGKCLEIDRTQFDE